MKFDLGPQESIAFNPKTGAVVTQVDIANLTCVLDIRSNMHLDMGGFGLFSSSTQGNFSQWMTIDKNQCVAVSGLASCGAIFIANEDFTKLAAGHMGGDAQLVDDWCRGLTRTGPMIKPYYILLGVGPSGSREGGPQILAKYVEHFGTDERFAHVVVVCGAMLLTPLEGGVAHATSDTRVSCERTGQAIPPKTEKIPEQYKIILKLQELKGFDQSDLAHQTMLLIAIAHYYNEMFPFSVTKETQEANISGLGKGLVVRFYNDLPPNSSSTQFFLDFHIWKLHPDWRQALSRV